MTQEEFDKLVADKAEEKHITLVEALVIVCEELEKEGIEHESLYDDYIQWLAS